MAKKHQALLSWSGGKDSALALYESRLRGRINITTLLTTIELPSSLTPVHRLHSSLIELQAMRIGLPLKQVFMSDNAGKDEYEAHLLDIAEPFSQIGIRHMTFGDIFLQPMRKYREDLFRRIDMDCLFPLWGKNTAALSERFFKAGFRAKVICVNAKYLSGDYVGREYDAEFVASLPEHVDPCGENGEFHTYVYAGPIFKRPIECVLGERYFIKLPAPDHADYDTAFWNVPIHVNFK